MSYLIVIGEGRLVHDPKLEQVKNGTDICNVNMAFSLGWGTNKYVTYIQLTIWGKQAKFVCDNFSKGDGLLVEASLKQDRWVCKQSGDRKSKHRLEARQVQFPIPKLKSSTGNPQQDPEDSSDSGPDWPTEYDSPDKIPF